MKRRGEGIAGIAENEAWGKRRTDVGYRGGPREVGRWEGRGSGGIVGQGMAWDTEERIGNEKRK